MDTIIKDTNGLIHLISAAAALILGTLVLAMNKGTKSHRQIGYGYVISMLVLNITAFSIYRLFHRFGPFHIASVISTVTLLMGFLPALFRKYIKSWIYFHVSGMYYSVIGLYAAFVAEVAVRIPGASFFSMVIAGTIIVMGIGMFTFSIKRKTWIAQNSSEAGNSTNP